ncbi:pirin-like C-terminal cupin domain-containing protein [Acinetobacter sp. ANC 4648]|uniref:pirin-like C-terminal cupin domain-containing protein n=1 Tax=Acinetobacter sp. ANC 4648 TaxID=1977875 RepID=UPI001D177C6E|nr:pirin-like C-terminal cupin domain-containing protein [Acinetobacter sp. ANC 4648]
MNKNEILSEKIYTFAPFDDEWNALYVNLMWREHTPHVQHIDAQNHLINIRIISGSFEGVDAIPRPIHSWAADKNNKVNIFMLTLDAHAEINIPATSPTSNRFAYFYQGSTLEIENTIIQFKHLVELKPDEIIHIKAGDEKACILWLEGEPIKAPVVLGGPFVLNTDQELNYAFKRYRETHFGKWPWVNSAPVFSREQKRFASYNGGSEKEFPE